MSVKNKNIASQALLEMDAITSAIKEESKKSINLLLAEAVKSALRESCNEEEKDYEVVDGDNNGDNKPSDGNETNSKKSENEAGGNPEDMDGGDESGNATMNQPQSPEPEMGGAEQGAEEVPNADQMVGGEEGSGEEGWDEFSDYQVGDSNTYDLTGENDYDTVVKVYKLLNDEDQVVVKKDGDTLKLQDNNAGTEYLIDLGGGDDNAQAESVPQEGPEMGGEEMPKGLNESLFDDLNSGLDDNGIVPTNDFVDDVPFEDGEGENDMAGFPPTEDEPDFNFSEDEFTEDPQGFGDEEFDELMEGKINNNKKARKPMKESKERKDVLFEIDLGYTDNYQDKDPIAGLSNNEPSKDGKSWHKGVPTGTKKPWAGDTKSKGDPFKDTQKVQGSVNEEDFGAAMEGGELEEGSTTVSTQPMQKQTMQHVSKPREEHKRQVSKQLHTSQDGPITTNESKELKAIKNENKELKKAILELRKNLNEAYITNINLGKITKLFLENTTSKQEKIDIVNRFSNEAKTVEQSNTLYESINKQLKNKQQINLNESSATANGTKTLNEQKVYKSNDLLKTIDLMGRVLNC